MLQLSCHARVFQPLGGCWWCLPVHQLFSARMAAAVSQSSSTVVAELVLEGHPHVNIQLLLLLCR